MPRKQRFKPSRKPKPIVTAQPDGTMDLGDLGDLRGASAQHAPHAQHIEMPRAPEVDMPPGPADVRSSPHADEAEAR